MPRQPSPHLVCGVLIIAACLLFVPTMLSATAAAFSVIHRFAPFPNGGNKQSALILGSDGNFYGTSAKAGAYGAGAVYRMTPSGAVTILHSFNDCDGYDPEESLVQASDGNLYGVTRLGGSHGIGTVFRVTPGGVFTSLHDFTGPPGDGSYPLCQMAASADGSLYGTTTQDGFGHGTFFRVTLAGEYTSLHAFAGSTEGSQPSGALALAPDGNFYGTTQYGPGNSGNGTVFRITPNGVVTTISGSDFNQNAQFGVILGTDGNLYGYAGLGYGSVFRMTLSGTLTWLYNFVSIDEAGPFGRPVQAADGNLYGTTVVGGDQQAGSVFRLSPVGVLTILHSFQSATDGDKCFAGLCVGTDGGLYGLTSSSGPSGLGTVFRMAANGAFSVIQAYGPPSDGYYPGGGFTQGADGYLYGTTYLGGAALSGTVFRMDTSGNVSLLHSFVPALDGNSPRPNLVFGLDGNLYGTVSQGGVSGNGTLYRITPAGVQTILHSFTGGADGGTPSAGLTIGPDGNFYGITIIGGTANCGVIYRITPAGVFTPLVSMPAGEQSAAPLTLGPDGTLYGLASGTGTNPAKGYIFHVDSSNVLSNLYTFPAGKPVGSLLLAQNGNFYGVATDGLFTTTPAGLVTYFHTFTDTPVSGLTLGPDGTFYGLLWNSVYNVTVSGVLSTVHLFQGHCDGFSPHGNLLLASDGNLYGSTTQTNGGGGLDGAVFKIVIAPPVLTSISVSPDSATVNTSATQQFSAVAKDQNGNPMPSEPAFTWTVTGGGTISTTGLFSANGTTGGGPFTVTATSDAVSGTATVTVNFVPVLSSITVTPSTATVNTGATQQFTATAKDQNGNPMPNQPVFTWAISGGGTINASGLFTANSTTGGGPFAVSAAAGSKSGTASVTVVFVPVVTSITVTPPSATVNTSATQQFTATAKDQNGNPMSPQPAFTWTAASGGTISPSGLFTAGSAAGAPFIVTATSGAVFGTATVTVTAIVAPIIDFNGDGYPDLVLRNGATNAAALWYVKNGALIGGAYTSVTPAANWSIVGAVDFNGDGKTDLVLQNLSTNTIALWYMNGPALLTGAYVSMTPGPGWRVIGAHDFNGDGKSDLLLQNTVSGKIALWYLNGAAVTGGQYVSLTLPSGWNLSGAGDFNNDNKTDLVLQNATTGKVAIWYLNATGTVTGSAYLSTAPPTGWKVVAVGDYNKDGKTDLVLQDSASNKIAFWYLNGTALVSGQYLSVTPPTVWSVSAPR